MAKSSSEAAAPASRITARPAASQSSSAAVIPPNVDQGPGGSRLERQDSEVVDDEAPQAGVSIEVAQERDPGGLDLVFDLICASAVLACTLGLVRDRFEEFGVFVFTGQRRGPLVPSTRGPHP